MNDKEALLELLTAIEGFTERVREIETEGLSKSAANTISRAVKNSDSEWFKVCHQSTK